MTYYSRRGKKLSSKVSEEFWKAFKAFVIDFASKDRFPDFSKWERTCDGVYCFIDPERINLKMAQELGKELYTLEGLNAKPDDETIFDLIEFFFKYVSKPLDNEKYNGRQGRYDYTIRINKLFDNFRLSYQLKKGEVKAKHLQFFDEYISKIDFEIPDEETKNLLTTAIDKFYSREWEDQKIGLEKLVDASQRITTWEDPDKKKSINKILGKVSAEQEEMKEILDEDWEELWKIANEFMIRHTERGKIPINDIDSLEYLFYAYFNVIRFILKKYDYIKEIEKKAQEMAQEVEELEDDEELPF